MSAPTPRFSLAMALFFSTGLACGDKGKAEAATGAEGATAATGATGSPAATGASAATGAAAPTTGASADDNLIGLSPEASAKLRADAIEARTFIAQARKRAEAEDWAGAAALYAKAAQLDADNPRILAERGWSQFNAKDLEAADASLRAALRYERDTEHRAEVLYKLGRVEEERGDFVRAKVHFDHSLALRDDEETRSHGQAVGDKAAAACADGKCEKPDFENLDEACKALVARVHAQQGITAEEAGEEFTCFPETAKKIELTGGDASEAAILVVKGVHAGTHEEQHDLLVHIEGGWHWVGTFLDLENPHDGGISREGKIESFEAKELLPNSPGPELLIKLSYAESDVDLDENIVYHDEHEAYLVCGINKGTHVCHEIPTRMSWEAAVLDPKQAVEHALGEHGFEATATFDGKGNVTVEGTGEVPEAEKGTHPISSLPEPVGFVFLHEDDAPGA